VLRLKTEKSKFGFHWKYACVFAGLFLVEVCIALFLHDGFIRPFLGDMIVVWLVYAFVRSFYAGGKDWQVAAGVLAFAVLVEVGQYFGLVSLLGLEESRLARVAIGLVFDWKDILAYGVGAVVLIVISKKNFVSFFRFSPSESGKQNRY